jgi:hypothetical protein
LQTEVERVDSTDGGLSGSFPQTEVERVDSAFRVHCDPRAKADCWIANRIQSCPPRAPQ